MGLASSPRKLIGYYLSYLSLNSVILSVLNLYSLVDSNFAKANGFYSLGDLDVAALSFVPLMFAIFLLGVGGFIGIFIVFVLKAKGGKTLAKYIFVLSILSMFFYSAPILYRLTLFIVTIVMMFYFDRNEKSFTT